MRSDVVQRMKEVIRAVTTDRRRLKELEEETGIPARNWKNAWLGTQRPTAHMLEAIGRRWPKYAFWLISGLTDERNGHTAPKGAWTCNQNKSSEKAEKLAEEFFELKILLQDTHYGMSDAATGNYDEKKNPTEEELAAARLERSSYDPESQAYFDRIYGKEVKVFKKKHTDLDEALAEIAFDKRLNTLKERFLDVDPSIENFEQTKNVIEAIQTKRLAEAKASSSK